MSIPTTDIPDTIDVDLENGQQVGEYVVEGKLGQGAFGTVFKATHPLIGKNVAVKVLSHRFSVDPEMVSRFVAEARAVNQIQHRHIIDIFSFGKLDDGRQYYVMEYLDGETLDALLGRGRVPIGEALTILRAIAKALDAAHAKGIAHRDLKAENIFLARDTDGGVFPKLLDFGIAKLLGPEDTLKHKTRTGAPIGTPYYMSPEQCRGRDVDHRTDLYAFGVLAYLMLTGTYPFDADSYMSILMKQISDQPAAPSTLAAELPSQIDDVIGWLMAKEPAQRPPDLRTAMRALDQAASSAGLIGPLPTSSMDAQSGAPSSSQGAIAVPRFSSSTSVPPADPLLVPPRRSRLLLIVGAIVAMGVIVAVVALVAWPAATSTPTPQALPEPPSPPDPIRPVAAPPPAPVAAPPIVEQPQTVIITITGVPDGTEVFAGGMTVGAAPGPVQLPRAAESTVLTFKADGYLAVSKSVIPDRDRSIAVELKKKSGSRSKRNTKNDILDPFGAKR